MGGKTGGFTPGYSWRTPSWFNSDNQTSRQLMNVTLATQRVGE